MKKCALILSWDFKSGSIEKGNQNYTVQFVERYYYRGIKKIKLKVPCEDIEIYIIKVAEGRKSKDIFQKILKVLDWCNENEFCSIAYGGSFSNKHKDFIVENALNRKLNICFGEILKLAIYKKTLKRIIKAKGIEMNQMGIIYIPGTMEQFEYEMIKFLMQCAKYFTYIDENNSYFNYKDILNKLEENTGQSIVICKDLEKCVDDGSVIANFGGGRAYGQKTLHKCKLIVQERNTNWDDSKYLGTMINEIVINIESKLRVNNLIQNVDIYTVGEMYLLLKMQLESTRDIDLKMDECNTMYERFIKAGFCIGSLSGYNL